MLFKNAKSAVNELRNELTQPAYSGCENPKAAAETAGQIVWLCQSEGANRFDWQASGVALAPFFRDEEAFRLFHQTVAMLCMERLIMAAAKRRSPNGFYAIDEDAEQEARLAVYKAASQFDGRDGSSFTTYVNALLPKTVYRFQLQDRLTPIPEDHLRVNPHGKRQDLREQAKQMHTICSLSDPDVNGNPVGDSVIDRSASPVDDVGAAESIRSLTTGVAIVYGAEYVPVLDDQLSHRADEAEARWTAVARRMISIKTFHNALTESAGNFGCDAADAHRISVLYVTNTAALQRWLDRQPESMRKWVSAAETVGITDDEEAVSTRSIRDYRNSLFGPLVVGKADPQDLARRAALVAYLRDSGEDALASRFEDLVSEG